MIFEEHGWTTAMLKNTDNAGEVVCVAAGPKKTTFRVQFYSSKLWSTFRERYAIKALCRFDMTEKS